MASNNLAIGAEALLKAGAQVNVLTQKPYLQSNAKDVVRVLSAYGGK
jgi:hypothetical protein